MPRLCILWILLFLGCKPASAELLQWSSSEVQYLFGSNYQIPFNNKDVSQSIITLTHADGWAYGRNFFFVDTLITHAGQPSQTNVYGEFYSYLSLSKLAHQDWSIGLIKDLNITVGGNLGQNFDLPKPGTRAFLYGVTLDFNLPGFKLFTVDFLQHVQFDPSPNGASWQITPVWNLPFEVAGLHFSLQGFTDFIGAKHANYVSNILAQPQLRLDIGEFWGRAEQLYIGIEYQYWHNKYGIKGLHEEVAQALLVLHF